ncbi:MAG: ATP-binding cassette domain-containing protein, partial [Coriobacteriia bacterium]|nr:ATP-binding cassette domain-containing protein [Coriobacteriia bacterium]
MNALTITDFSFSYPKQSEILSDVSMELASGSFNLLVGATGCGKTTLLRSIKPELAPVGSTTGAIEVFGRRTTQLDPYESATMIGYVSQSADNQIVCDSVWHELAFGLENLGID